MSVADLLPLVPAALELVKLLRAGEVDKAERKAKALAQAIGLKRGTRAVARATKQAIEKGRR